MGRMSLYMLERVMYDCVILRGSSVITMVLSTISSGYC